MQQKQLIAIILVIALVAVAAIGAVFLLKGDSGGETTYTVKYDTNGGNAIDDKEFTKNTDTFDLATPTKDGSTFLGWYLNADFSGDKITQVVKGTEKNITVYAKWQLDLANNTLPSAAQITANTDVKVTFDSGATDKTIPAAAVDELKAGKTLEVEDTVNKITWTMSGSDNKQTGYADQAMDTTVTPDTSLLASEKKITLDFAYDGTLPYESTIRYFIGTDVFPAGTLISIQNSGEAEPIGQFPVDAEGYVTFTITHCSDWVLTQYITLTLDGNGGTFTISEQTVATTTVGGNYNSDVPVLPVPSRTGYGFVPWDSPVKFTEDATLTAQWTANTYQVVFNKNSDAATGTMVAQDMTYDTEAALTANAFANEGHSFAGWATSADGDVVYTDGQAVKNLTDVLSGTVNLYAKWTVNQYNAVVAIGSDATRTNLPAGWVDNNNGSFTKAFDYGTAGADIIADFGSTAENTTKTGATFNRIEYQQPIMGTQGMFLLAFWDANTYTVTFNANDQAATGTMAPQNMTYGTSAALTSNGFSKDGGAFRGWATSADGAVVYTNGQTVSNLTDVNGGNVNLYAVWGNNNISVSFSLNGAPMANVGTVTVHKDANSAVMTETTTGTFTFESSGDVSIVNGETYTIKRGNDTVCEITVEDGSGAGYVYYYTVVFSGDSGVIETQTVLKDDVAVAIDYPSRTGYTCNGWRNEATGNNWVFSTPITAHLELVPDWAAKTYTVTFNKAEGAGGSDSVTATYDAVLPDITVPAKEGSQFLGYFLGDVQYISNQGKGTKTWDVDTASPELVAHWGVIQYTAAINLGGGSIGSGNVGQGWQITLTGYEKDFDYGTAVTAIIADFGVTPVKEYYTFGAWSPNSGTIGTEGITITAGYVLQNFTIAFNVNGGSGSVASIQNVKLGDTIDQPAYTGTRAGYENAGSWCYDEYGSLNVPFAEGQLNVSGAVLDYAENNTVTFYAKWTQINYTVTFNLNTGSGNVPGDLTNKHYGDAITLARPTASKDTKFFGGWNTKADGTGTNYSVGNVTINDAFVEFAQGTTVTLYINWVDGLYTATLGDIFGGHTYYYNQGGDQIGSVEFRAMVIRADASTYDIEMMFNEQGTWIADSYMTIAQGNYPQLYGNDPAFAEYIRGGDQSLEPLQVSFNGVTGNIWVTAYTRDYNGVHWTMAEDADLTCFYLEMEMGGGGMEYSHSKQVIETVLTGAGNGYTPTPIAVQYKASQNAQTSIPYSSANYQTPEAIGMPIPDGMEFRGWMLMDDDYHPEGDNPMLTTAHAVGCARTVYAVFTEIVLTPTNIDWEVHNLPAGITLTINGEDAYESDGSPSYPLIFTGGTNWSKREVDDGQYCYTFTLDQTVYHAQIRKGNSTHITENPDGDRMRVAFNALGDGQRYSITIYFWMDDPLMGGYMPTVNDSFTYHEESFISVDTTYTVEEVNSDYSYDATDGNRSYIFGPFLYPQDNYIVYLLNSEVTDNQGAGLYTHRISTETFLNGQVECYVMENSVYQRYWNQSTERTVRTETMVNQGFYGKDNGLLYQYNNDAIAHFTVTLTSKPAQMRSVTQYEAVLDGNGGTFGGEPTTVRDYSFTFDATTPRWNDHALTGWNTQANGSGRSYVDGDVFNPADLVEGRIVLYAQWVMDGYYLNIIADEGGTPATATREVLFSEMNLGTITHYVYEFTEITAPANKAAGSYRVESLNYEFTEVMFKYPNHSFTPNGDGSYRYGGDSDTYYKFGNKEVYYYLFEYNEIRRLTVIPEATETVDIHLVWTDQITAVTFHSNYGLDNTVTVNYAQLGSFDGLFPAADLFTRDGYAFLGWGATADADPRNCAPAGDYYDRMMGTEFWAIWAPSMTVVYHANGGTGTIADQILTEGNNTLNNGSAYSKEDWILVGWATSEGSNVLAYPLSGNYVMEEAQAGTTLNLYALWSTSTYTVRFNMAPRGAGEFEGEMANQVIGTGISTPLNKLGFRELTGFYEFGYWVLSEDGSGPSYADQEAVLNLTDPGETITLNAWWIPTKYTVHYMLNMPAGKEWDQEAYDQLISVGVETALTACTFFGDEDYAFNDWNTRADGTGTSFTNEQLVTDLTVGGDTFTLYAQWIPTKYTVNYGLNAPREIPDGIEFNGEMGSQIIYVGVATELYPCEYTVTYAYYTFIGWNTRADGTGTSYTNGQEVTDITTPGGTIALFAQWVRTSYTLVFYCGDENAEGTMASVNRLVGDGVAMPECGFTCDGKHFAYWCVEVDGDSFEVTPGNTDDMCRINNAEVSVTAVWVDDE